MRFVCATVFLSIAVLLAGPVRGADLPTWDLARLPADDLQNFSPPAKDGDHTYRTAEAGTAVITVPSWWGKSFRPADGTVYDLRITYKDTAAEPVIVASHAGLDRGSGMRELHRFGGENDGKWKTALVPVSWDLLCKWHVPFEKTLDQTRFEIRTAGPLPVAKIEVLPAGKDAADRYYSETRAWVRRAQADRRAKVVAKRNQDPVLPEAVKDQLMIPFVRSYLTPVLINEAPQKGEVGGAIALRMARNEGEPAAFAIYANGKPLKNVTYSVTDLKDEKGNTLACEIDCRTAEYSVVSEGRDDNQRYVLYPQKLWPAYPVEVAAGQSHWFCLQVRTLGEKSRPGRYAGTVRITADGAAASVPLQVEVLPVTLLTMREADVYTGTCSLMVPEQDMQTLVANNHTGCDLWFTRTAPPMRVVDGKMEMDFTYLDDWMQRARRAGMDHMMWFLGGNPNLFPDSMTLERDLFLRARNASGADRSARLAFVDRNNENPEKVLPEIRDLYVQFVGQLGAHAKAHDWPGLLVLHPFDEPAKWVNRTEGRSPAELQAKRRGSPYLGIGTGPWIRPHFEDGCALIRKGAEGHDNILVGGDMHHAKPSMVFIDDVDVFCTNALHEDNDLAKKVRKGGAQFWQYSGCDDHAPPQRARFAFGFYFAANRCEGTLAWAYDSFGRFDTARANQWGYGWYTPFGTIYTPYMHGMREGFDDRRWVETYARAVGEKAAAPLLERIGTAAVKERTEGGRDTVNDFYAEVRRTDMLDEWRDEVINALLAARKKMVAAD